MINRVVIIGICAAGLDLLGIWLVGNKNKLCFPIFWLCGICWIITAIFSDPVTIGLLIVVPIATVINIRNYIKWSKNDMPII